MGPWISRENKVKGRSLIETFVQFYILLANEGNLITFRKGGSVSIVDLTLVTLH